MMADHRCDNPIQCGTCLNEQATKSTAKRTASRKAATHRAPVAEFRPEYPADIPDPIDFYEDR